MQPDSTSAPVASDIPGPADTIPVEVAEVVAELVDDVPADIPEEIVPRARSGMTMRQMREQKAVDSVAPLAKDLEKAIRNAGFKDYTAEPRLHMGKPAVVATQSRAGSGTYRDIVMAERDGGFRVTVIETVLDETTKAVETPRGIERVPRQPDDPTPPWRSSKGSDHDDSASSVPSEDAVKQAVAYLRSFHVVDLVRSVRTGSLVVRRSDGVTTVHEGPALAARYGKGPIPSFYGPHADRLLASWKEANPKAAGRAKG
jgi:hypothetical protein